MSRGWGTCVGVGRWWVYPSPSSWSGSPCSNVSSTPYSSSHPSWWGSWVSHSSSLSSCVPSFPGSSLCVSWWGSCSSPWVLDPCPVCLYSAFSPFSSSLCSYWVASPLVPSTSSSSSSGPSSSSSSSSSPSYSGSYPSSTSAPLISPSLYSLLFSYVLLLISQSASVSSSRSVLRQPGSGGVGLGCGFRWLSLP